MGAEWQKVWKAQTYRAVALAQSEAAILSDHYTASVSL